MKGETGQVPPRPPSCCDPDYSCLILLYCFLCSKIMLQDLSRRGMFYSSIHNSSGRYKNLISY